MRFPEDHFSRDFELCRGMHIEFQEFTKVNFKTNRPQWKSLKKKWAELRNPEERPNINRFLDEFASCEIYETIYLSQVWKLPVLEELQNLAASKNVSFNSLVTSFHRHANRYLAATTLKQCGKWLAETHPDTEHWFRLTKSMNVKKATARALCCFVGEPNLKKADEWCQKPDPLRPWFELARSGFFTEFESEILCYYLSLQQESNEQSQDQIWQQVTDQFSIDEDQLNNLLKRLAKEVGSLEYAQELSAAVIQMSDNAQEISVLLRYIELAREKQTLMETNDEVEQQICDEFKIETEQLRQMIEGLKEYMKGRS